MKPIDPLRAIGEHFKFETAEVWDGRSVDSKIAVILSETGGRLRGIAQILYTLASSNRADGGHDSEKFSFLASSVNDLALGLERARQAQREAWDADDEIRRKSTPKRSVVRVKA